jgi:hypothetical protein
MVRVSAMSLVALVCTGISVVPHVDATTTLPNPPTSVTATASTTTTAINLHWTFSTTGVTPDRAFVAAYMGKTLEGTVTCAFPVCTSISIPGLVPGDAYFFTVQAGVASGYSAVTRSNSVTVNWSCATANVCLTVNATTPGGAALHRAAGMEEGLGTNPPASLITPLDLKYWEMGIGLPMCTVANCLGDSEYDSVKAIDPTANITEVLSDNWYEDSYTAYRECTSNFMCQFENEPKPYGGAMMPWQNWTQFDQFTTSVVQNIEASGRTVNYWNLINEPPSLTNQNDEYFDGKDSNTLTPSDIEQWFLHAYHDVKAADPSAQIVCPSFEQYDDYVGEAPPNDQLLDFSTFLAFAQQNGIDCNAFSWHEINFVGSATDFNMQPQTIQDHVARFHALLAEYPQFAGAKIFINEYAANIPLEGNQLYETMPGWTVGYIAALEAAGVDQANHTCVPPNGCNYSLDDLLYGPQTSLSPSDTYWPYWYYAQMNGQVVPVTSSQEEISGFATINSNTNTLMMLLGRHDVEGTDGLPASETTTLTVNVPWNTPSVSVSTQPFADSGGVNDEPPVTITTVPVVNGVATIPIAAFGSENAYGITVTPSS